MILRAKTQNLFASNNLTERQSENTKRNLSEMKDGALRLQSKPQRLVFELTNACNLNCIMCGRNAAHFKETFFQMQWLDKFTDITEYVEEVTLMGWGEPTIHPHFTEFIKWASQHGLRKYFCTNGMILDRLKPTIFEEKVDVIAVSMDSAQKERNEHWRRGADFDKIISNLESLVTYKQNNNVDYPYINFVTTLMNDNLHELPDIIRLAHDTGLQEVKAVYLTAFDTDMQHQILFNHMDAVKKVFDDSEKLAAQLNIKLKLPHLAGEDPSANQYHKDCFTPWRDFFLGSDGYVRTCMSTAVKLFDIHKYETFDEMWNSQEFSEQRAHVNHPEKMHENCKQCYQSSFANWNREAAFLQVGNEFSPEW